MLCGTDIKYYTGMSSDRGTGNCAVLIRSRLSVETDMSVKVVTSDHQAHHSSLH